MSAKPEPSTVQEDPEDSISAAKNSKQQTFEEWLAARGNTAPTHVIGVSEDGGVEMYSHAVPQNGKQSDMKVLAQASQATAANGCSHAPPERSADAAKRSGLTESPAVNGGSYHVSGSRTAAAGHSAAAAASGGSQDELLQSMLGKVDTAGQPSPAQNGFHPAVKQPPATSREQGKTFSSAEARSADMTVAAASDSIQDNLLQSMLGEAGTAGQPSHASRFHPFGKQPPTTSGEQKKSFSAAEARGADMAGATPNVATLIYQQHLEAVIKKMQQDHDEKVMQC